MCIRDSITAESAADFQQLSIFTELQEAHSTLLDDYDYVARTYEQYDRQVFDYCKEGLAHFRFHPDGLAPRPRHTPPVGLLRFWQ